jgi:type II secretion system protein D
MSVLASMILSAIAGIARSQAPVQTPGVAAGGTAASGTAAPSASEATIESYPLNAASRPMLVRWQQQFAGRTDLHMAFDERTSQAIVNAPPAVHAQIRQQIAQSQAPAANGRPQTAGNGASAAQNALAAAPPLGRELGAERQAGPIVVQLRNMTAPELHARLEKMLGRAMPATPDASGQWSSFTVEASPGVAVTMSLNAGTGQVRIDGPGTQAAAWRSVVAALDAPPSATGNVTQLVTTKPTTHERVRRTLEVLQARGSNGRVADSSLVAMLLQQQDQADAGAGGQQQPADALLPPQQDETTQITPGTEQTAIDAARLAEAAGAILGPVDVEFVEGLDVIVLRGSERDVQRVMDIIRQIEELSAVTVPAIQIYNLQNVDSMQMGVLLNRLYAQVLGPRIGTVSITPLGRPNALLLIGRTENVQMAIQLIQQLDQPAMPTSQFQVFPLQHANAAEAKTLIDTFLRQDEEGEPQQDEEAEEPITEIDNLPPFATRALVVADIRTNFLIVRAAPRDMAEIAALVESIDRPGQAAQLKVFEIRNGDATTLVTMLRTLFGTPEDAAEAAAGGLTQGGVVRMQFAVDPRTNSIIAAGSADDMIVVESILLRLDQGDVRERETSVYRLKNAFAVEIANALNLWLQTERAAEAEAALTVSPFEQIEREVIIVPEPGSNSLLVSATPRYFRDIQAVIEQLDERPPMVIIQVLIAEVRLNDTDEFGVELGLQDSLLFDRSLIDPTNFLTLTDTTQTSTEQGIVTQTTQRIINAPGQPGFNFNNFPLGNNLSTAALATASQVAAQGLSSFSVNRINNDLGFGGFVFSASSNSVNILLRALQENRRLEILSRPQLMALDGQPGQIQVGQNVPRIVGVITDALGGTTNTILYEPVGLILNVLPRISPDGLVVMQITAQKSEVGPEAEGIPINISPQGNVLRAPRIEITQALTTVSALSGQTVVLGGLLQTRKFDVHRRVPLISDIPLIGDLFRYDSVAEERRELLIILTPRIVYGKQDADLVKQIESSRMSWILADVVNLHGEVGLRSRCDEWSDADIEAVYPNLIPEEGLLPLSERQMMPYEGQILQGPILEGPACEPEDATTQAEPPANWTPVGEPQSVPPQDETAPLPIPPQPPASSVPQTNGFLDDSAGGMARQFDLNNSGEEGAAGVASTPLMLPEIDQK